MSQTSYSDSLTVGRAGALADTGPHRIEGYFAEDSITWGLVVQRGTADDQVAAIAALPDADADAIATALASAATAQTFVSTDFDGDTGADLITPPQTVTLTLNAHADWLATLAHLTYLTADGSENTDVLEIPAGGDVVLKSQSPAKRVISLDIDAQGGTNGTIAVGLDTTEVALDREHYIGVAMYNPGVEPSTADTGDRDAEDPVDVVVKGVVWVTVEADVTIGDSCYVRMVESGTDLRGQVRGSPAANFARLVGAQFKSSAVADAVAKLEV